MLSELNDGQWQLIWQTSTVIFNLSDETVPALEWDDDERTLVLNEYIYREMPSIKPIRLWSVNATVSGDAVLALSDQCCVELTDSNRTYWSVCAETSAPTAEPTESDNGETLNDSITFELLQLWWFWLLICLLVGITCIIGCACWRYHTFAEDDWRKPTTVQLTHNATHSVSTRSVGGGRGVSSDTLIQMEKWANDKLGSPTSFRVTASEGYDQFDEIEAGVPTTAGYEAGQRSRASSAAYGAG